MNKLLILLSIIFFSEIILAQEDTIIYENISNDSIDKYDRIYKLFIQDKKEVKHLWKINLLDFRMVEPNVGFEKKIGKKFSFDSYVNFDNLPGFNYVYSISGQFDLKYYYNIPKRDQKGKNTNGFSANYFGIGLNGTHNTYLEPNTNPYLSQNTLYPYLGHGYTFNEYDTYKYQGLSIKLKYGIQRRIGNIGYFEPYISYRFLVWHNYLECDNYFNIPLEVYFPFEMRIKVGFAIDSFKGLKQRFK